MHIGNARVTSLATAKILAEREETGARDEVDCQTHDLPVGQLVLVVTHA